MAVIGLCTGTTQDWQDTIGRLILIERELGVEITNDGYYLIRMGNGKDDFFDLPIIVNNKRYEEILDLISTDYDDVTEMYDKVAEMLADTEKARDNAQTSEENAHISEENSENSALLAKSYAVGGSGLDDRVSDEDTDNSKYYSEQAKASERTTLIYKEDSEKVLEEVKEVVKELNLEAISTEFKVDLNTGELMYTKNSMREFRINETTGELEWRFTS